MTEGQFDRLAYSVDDAAALVSVGTRTIYREIAAGRLRIAKLGKRTLVPAEALNDWLAAATKAAKSRAA